MEAQKKKIGIVGSGAMGSGIAQVAATAGHQVIISDNSKDALKRSEANLNSTLDKLVEKQKLTGENRKNIGSRIRYVSDLNELVECELVIEAIVENLDIKKELFRKLENIVQKTCILASNTSSLSITSIASAVKDPSRVLGIHFFNPAPLMPLVEIIPGIATASDHAEKYKELIASWGKVPVITKDTPGFIVNRVARPFYSEALRIYEEGIADMPTIDWAMKTIGGFKMGPFELMDLIGHDVNYVVTETVWREFYFDPRFKPALSQKRLLEAGFLGRKSGRGFYQYGEGAAAPAPTENKELGEEIFWRIFAMLVNEAADALYLRVATAADIDLAMTKGVNYPKGLLSWADEVGVHNVVEELERLRTLYEEDRYRACPLLKETARQNGKLRQ